MATQPVILINAPDTDDLWFCEQSHSIAQHIFQRGALWTLWVDRRVIDWIVRAYGLLIEINKFAHGCLVDIAVTAPTFNGLGDFRGYARV